MKKLDTYIKFCDNRFVNAVKNSSLPAVGTALATPFKHGKIHFADLVKAVELQQKHADFVVVLGTTAEPNSLTCEERKQVISAVKLHCDLPVVVGVSASGTTQAIQQACAAQKLGADGILLSPPSFSKCTPNGYVKHVLKVVETCRLPTILYNAPLRAGYPIDKNIVHVLAEKGVKFVKDAANETSLTNSATKFGASCFCGNDGLYDEFLTDGACGTISVVANVAPLLVKAVGAIVTNKLGKDKNLLNVDKQLLTVYNKLARLSVLEINPIVIKYLLYKAGIFDSYEMRLPLTKACRNTRKQIDELWEEYGKTLTKLNSEVIV